MSTRKPLKIFNLGLPKSGTTTLGEALKHAGLNVADWRIRRGQSTDNRHLRAFVGQLIYRGYFETGDPLANMQEFDAFTEVSIVRGEFNLWPQLDFGVINALRSQHPELKFVMTYRNPAKLSDSMARWSNMGTTRLPNNAIPGLPEGYGGTDAERIRWIEGHYAFCRHIFAGSDRFFEYDIEDPEAQTKLSAFLGIELPWWGVANENPATRDAQPPAK